MARAQDFKRELEWLKTRFSELFNWFSNKGEEQRDWNQRQAVERAMRRGFSSRVSEVDTAAKALKVRDFFFDLGAIQRELIVELSLLEKNSHPAALQEPSAWDEWIRSMVEAMESSGLPATARADEEGIERPSKFVLLISHLQQLLPASLRNHTQSVGALANAINRARTNVANEI